MQQLKGRVAVVTGAASGIGRGIAKQLASEGMRLVLADVEQDALDRTIDDLTNAGAEAVGVVTDVSDRSAVENLADATMDAFGAVHLVCNNAGVETGGSFDEIPVRSWRWVLDVNVLGVVHGCQVFLPLLRRQPEGHIVNTASVASFESSVPTMAPYTASKFAVLGFTEALAYELRRTGDRIGVSLLAPGFVRTRMAEAERNRPSDVPGTLDDPMRRAVMNQMTQAMATVGMEPEEVGALTADAVRENRFFIFTHPEIAVGGLRKRLEWMESGDMPDVVNLG